MRIFQAYAEYYDLLYKDKDYPKEAQFIQQLLQKHAPSAQNILELGSGTGRHAEYLAQQGYSVIGVEKSEDMLSQCYQRQARQDSDVAQKLKFLQGDLRGIQLEEKFDCVLALFHVLSYQTSNIDLISAFESVSINLKPGGIFIFDVWYGPAVLHNKPQVRTKRVEDKNRNIIRIAEPVLHSNENIVDVEYQILVQNSFERTYQELRELHRMRYLFKPEVDLFLSHKNMSILDYGEWMTKQSASLNTWNVYFIAVKQ